MQIDEAITRQLTVEADKITPEAWRSFNDFERAYCVINHTGNFSDEIADEADYIRYMIPDHARTFLEV